MLAWLPVHLQVNSSCCNFLTFSANRGLNFELESLYWAKWGVQGTIGRVSTRRIQPTMFRSCLDVWTPLKNVKNCVSCRQALQAQYTMDFGGLFRV